MSQDQVKRGTLRVGRFLLFLLRPFAVFVFFVVACMLALAVFPLCWSGWWLYEQWRLSGTQHADETPVVKGIGDE